MPTWWRQVLYTASWRGDLCVLTRTEKGQARFPGPMPNSALERDAAKSAAPLSFGVRHQETGIPTTQQPQGEAAAQEARHRQKMRRLPETLPRHLRCQWGITPSGGGIAYDLQQGLAVSEYLSSVYHLDNFSFTKADFR